MQKIIEGGCQSHKSFTALHSHHCDRWTTHSRDDYGLCKQAETNSPRMHVECCRREQVPEWADRKACFWPDNAGKVVVPFRTGSVREPFLPLRHKTAEWEFDERRLKINRTRTVLQSIQSISHLFSLGWMQNCAAHLTEMYHQKSETCSSGFNLYYQLNLGDIFNRNMLRELLYIPWF